MKWLRNRRWVSIFHRVGNVLAVLGIAFVALRYRQYSGQINQLRYNPNLFIYITGLALVSAASNLLLAMAWRNLLQKFGATVGRRWALKTYGISQLAKYVPGNIFHLASRHSIGLAAQVPLWPLTKSTVAELVLIAAAGAHFAFLCLPMMFVQVSKYDSAGLFVIAVCFSLFLLARYAGMEVLRAFFYQLSFLTVSGTLFALVVALISSNWPVVDLPWFSVIAAYVIGWLAGLVTPGAPAGAGIREMVVLLLFGNLDTGTYLIHAILITRTITIVGDFLFFFYASLLLSPES
ncbi:hypothetical protein SAMN02745206_00208 [Desulfacinum infernum DSM 9756]|uniref:Lysylphosphatidylglycerol synthase TM region n=2 Tax=Desulfacinum infernum TaxID=35837 RepID=A0A1M4SX79_9BACT|nr:hypothetical protein SAMN02745206_00208 [Desulfacinum infernum DSM 9756]